VCMYVVGVHVSPKSGWQHTRVCLTVRRWSSDLEGWRPLHYADRLECFKQQGAAKEMFVAQSPRSPPCNHRKPQVHCPCNVACTNTA
jgi:hypothetical protein